jgi:hypothetical protein
MKVSLRGLLLKTLVLLVVFNALYYVVQPLSLINRVTVYNTLVPGRKRLPFSEFPEASYSISVLSLDQLLASHEIARHKAPDEFRVAMLGDSAVWGYLLEPDQTQTECLNRLNLTLPSGRRVRVYNLGHPTLTVTKDLLILRHALQYQPDLILWPTTLASLYPSDQLDFPLIRAQYDELAALIDQYKFKFYQWPLSAPAWLDRSFVGQRRELADWLRYQLYGLGWLATREDHTLPRFVAKHPTSLVPDDNLLSVGIMHVAKWPEKRFSPEDLSFDVVKVGIQMAAAQRIPVLLVNEPMWRTDNHDLRWNTYYPKWAYDSYREEFREVAAYEGWRFADLWDAVPLDQFTDTDFHMTPAATCEYAKKLAEPLMALAAEPVASMVIARR